MGIIRGRIWGVLIIGLLVPACGVGGGGTLTPTIAPAIPTNVTALSGNKRITLTWSSPFSTSTFTLKRASTSGGPYFPISVPSQFSGPTTYVDAGLSNGTSYYYVVSAGNQFGQSADSAEVRGIPGFRPLSVGAGPAARHTLALLPDRTLWSFGLNGWGQLGNGFASGQFSSPVEVRDLEEVTASAAGEEHSLALRSDGSVWAWGRNQKGQLGQGSAAVSPIPLPTPVPGVDNIVAVAAGQFHSLALKNDGTVWAWGDNASGQIGNASFGSNSVPTPFPVPGLNGVMAISAGRAHNLALRSDGTVWVWGANLVGQLGQGAASATPVTTPAQVPNLTGVIAVAAGGAHSVVARDDGSVWNWGSNAAGLMGIQSGQSFIPSPIKVTTISQAISVVAGSDFSYVLKNDGSVQAWGNNGEGQSGLGTKTPSTFLPTTIPSLQSVGAIAAGERHGLALRSDGAVLAWGMHLWGQVGIGFGPTYNSPFQIPNFTNVVATAAGEHTAVALRGDGTVWTWGHNDRGQLGNGSVSATTISSPYLVPGLSGMKAVAASAYQTFAVKGDGSIWAWGNNSSGSLGQGSASGAPTPSPVMVQNLPGVFTAVAPGSSHVIALRNDGTLWGWGSNAGGTLGLGSLSPPLSYTPVQVIGLTGVTAISSGAGHTLALKDDGTVWAWGYNSSGQIGNGAAVGVGVPAVQQVLSGAVAISAAPSFSLALKSDGTVWAWGSRDIGQLGDGVTSPTPALVPVQIPGFDSVVKIAAGYHHSVAVRTDGSVWSWGFNGFGALGTGDETSSNSPVRVLDILGPSGLSVGLLFNLARMPDGTLKGWGWNGFGTLATPIVMEVLLPTPILQ